MSNGLVGKIWLILHYYACQNLYLILCVYLFKYNLYKLKDITQDKTCNDDLMNIYKIAINVNKLSTINSNKI